MPSACALCIVRGKNIFILDSEKSADFSKSLFHGKGAGPEVAASRFIFAFWKVYNDCYRCCFPLRPSREKANRENPQIFPIGEYK